MSETLARYRVLIGPTLAYEAADARATAFWLTAVLAVGYSTLLADVRSDQASPTSSFV